MSSSTRERVANDSKMRYTADTQRADLLDPSRTNTYLIAMLAWQLDNLWLPVLVLSVRAGRSTGMHAVGCALDMYPANWSSGEKATVVDMMNALAKNPFCQAVGLGGITRNWRSAVSWPAPSVGFVLFDDNDTDHLHAACSNSLDPPGYRAKKAGYTKYTG